MVPVLRAIRSLKGINLLRMSTARSDNTYYVWIDLEMTGLEVDKHRITEIACIVTKPDLKPLHEGISMVVHQPQHVIDAQAPWPKANLQKLSQASLESKISEREADEIVSNYVKEKTNYRNHPGIYYLAGNSVHMDRIFLEKYMPSLFSLLHYRIIDVSTIKVLVSRWYPEAFASLPQKESKHRALADILNSIEELQTYKEKFFIPFP